MCMHMVVCLCVQDRVCDSECVYLSESVFVYVVFVLALLVSVILFVHESLHVFLDACITQHGRNKRNTFTLLTLKPQ